MMWHKTKRANWFAVPQKIRFEEIKHRTAEASELYRDIHLIKDQAESLGGINKKCFFASSKNINSP